MTPEIGSSKRKADAVVLTTTQQQRLFMSRTNGQGQCTVQGDGLVGPGPLLQRLALKRDLQRLSTFLSRHRDLTVGAQRAKAGLEGQLQK